LNVRTPSNNLPTIISAKNSPRRLPRKADQRYNEDLLAVKDARFPRKKLSLSVNSTNAETESLLPSIQYS